VEKSGFRPTVQSTWDSLISYSSDEKYELEVDGVNGIFYTESEGEVRIFYPEFSERKVMGELLSHINASDVFYDIGAHVGVYTCMIGQKLDEGQVYAFEPHPSNIDRIKENADNNDVEADFYECFLSNEDGEVVVPRNSAHAGARTGLLTDKSDPDNPLKKPVYQAESLIRTESSLSPPTVLKLDVDGAEADVLQGFGEYLQNCKVIFCEIHPTLLQEYGSSEEQVMDLFENAGFEIERFSSLGDRYHVIAHSAQGQD
jgi:FkbM family methyltransferase